jgi:DNA invertase Pin-like site-specific DNA recombinase
MFKKKRSAETLLKAEEIKRREIQKALRISDVQLPEKKEFYPYPKEYIKFLELINNAIYLRFSS